MTLNNLQMNTNVMTHVVAMCGNAQTRAACGYPVARCVALRIPPARININTNMLLRLRKLISCRYNYSVQREEMSNDDDNCCTAVALALALLAMRNKNGGEGHRSPYLSHAKRTLYHLSYTPANDCLPLPAPLAPAPAPLLPSSNQGHKIRLLLRSTAVFVQLS